ncbi:MAG: hypothetical protein ACE5GV_07840 [Candidatus Scalindua sp.]
MEYPEIIIRGDGEKQYEYYRKDVFMGRVKEYIDRIMLDIHKRIKEARIEAYNDHVAGCDECQGATRIGVRKVVSYQGSV